MHSSKPSIRLEGYSNTNSLREPESAIRSISSDDFGVTITRQSAKLVEYISKESLATARVVRQVDGKFILTIMPVATGDPVEKCPAQVLVLVDQHAADERIKLEHLCREFCLDHLVTLAQPLTFEVDNIEAQMFRSQKDYFSSWNFSYIVFQTTELKETKQQNGSNCCMRVEGLPSLIVERCRSEPRVLIDMLRRQIWSQNAGRNRDTLAQSASEDKHYDESWISAMVHCPAGVLDLLKSRSCRTAIMFNDELTGKQCTELVQRLSRCAFPLQCAHGRPTLVVITEVDALINAQMSSEIGSDDDGSGFGNVWKKWSAIR
jgi:DNA mismatch repair protein MLH3